jgi:hypothetical protein
VTDQPADQQTTRPRGGDGRYVASPDTAERDAEAARLRGRGWSYRRIATELGYASHSSARDAVMRCINTIREEPAEDVRQLELERLDAMWEAATRVLETEHVTVSQGKVVMLDDQPVKDDAPVLRAIETMLKIQQRRAGLLGLDAKTQHDMGIAEQQVAIARDQGELFAGVFFRILDALGLTEEQQARAVEVMPQELRAIEGGAA